MKITKALLGTAVLFVLASAPQLAQAQLESCVATYTDFAVNTAEAEVEAWAWVEDYFSGWECGYPAYFQWGYWEHAYFASVSIESPTQRSAYDEEFTELVPYGGGSASASTSLSYIGEPGEYDIEWLIWIFCTIGEYFVNHFDGQVVEVAPAQSCPLPPYQFHQMFPYGGGRMQVVPTGTLSSGQLNVTAYVYTTNQFIFDNFDQGVTSAWNKTFTGPGVNLTVHIDLIRLEVPLGHDVSVTMPNEPPPGGPNNNPNPDNCGEFTPGPGANPDSILVRNTQACDVGKTSAHEFGHDMRFIDAYVEDMWPLALHCDVTDVMAWGNQVHTYHAQLLWERLP